MVFTEFIERVQATWSLDRVDDIIADARSASGGAYTAVGTYPHDELAALVGALSARTGQPGGGLVSAYLSKPITLSKLRAAIQGLLVDATPADSRPGPADHPQQPARSTPPGTASCWPRTTW